MKRQQTKSVHP